jgi:hypothetical protein
MVIVSAYQNCSTPSRGQPPTMARIRFRHGLHGFGFRRKAGNSKDSIGPFTGWSCLFQGIAKPRNRSFPRYPSPSGSSAMATASL